MDYDIISQYYSEDEIINNEEDMDVMHEELFSIAFKDVFYKFYEKKRYLLDYHDVRYAFSIYYRCELGNTEHFEHSDLYTFDNYRKYKELLKEYQMDEEDATEAENEDLTEEELKAKEEAETAKEDVFFEKYSDKYHTLYITTELITSIGLKADTVDNFKRFLSVKIFWGAIPDKENVEELYKDDYAFLIEFEELLNSFDKILYHRAQTIHISDQDKYDYFHSQYETLEESILRKEVNGKYDNQSLIAEQKMLYREMLKWEKYKIQTQAPEKEKKTNSASLYKELDGYIDRVSEADFNYIIQNRTLPNKADKARWIGTKADAGRFIDHFKWQNKVFNDCFYFEDGTKFITANKDKTGTTSDISTILNKHPK